MEYDTITISNTNDVTSTTTYTDDWNVTIIGNDSFGFSPGMHSINWYSTTGYTGPTGSPDYINQHSYIVYQEEILKYKTFIQKSNQRHNPKIQRWLAILHRRA